MGDDEDLDFISLSGLFGDDFLHEELEYLKDREDMTQIEGHYENDSKDAESVPVIHKCDDVKKKSIANLQSVMRNKLFKMSSKEVAIYLTDISLGLI